MNIPDYIDLPVRSVLPELAAGAPEVLGPAPAPVMKLNNRYRYRLTLTARNSHPLRLTLAALLRAAHRDKENKGIALYVDVNPY